MPCEDTVKGATYEKTGSYWTQTHWCSEQISSPKSYKKLIYVACNIPRHFIIKSDRTKTSKLKGDIKCIGGIYRRSRGHSENHWKLSFCMFYAKWWSRGERGWPTQCGNISLYLQKMNSFITNFCLFQNGFCRCLILYLPAILTFFS
jgi:hypothetical protein